jgi:hypothetical protein
MDPTSMSHAKGFDIDIGGTVFCGDSGSLVGNEGNMGLDRSSSDNLATQYSLWDPQILAPKPTARLPIPKLSYGSIFVCGATPGSLKPLSLQPFPVAASGSQKKPDSSRQGQNTAQPPFKQPADPAFALFQELYFNYYKGEFFTNPYSTMRQKLRDNEISTLAEVRAYALEHPGTRTVKVLKIFDALQEVNPVDDLQPFKTNYWQAYNSTFFHNPYSKMRTLLLSDETHPVTMDDIKKQVINDPHSRSAKVLCGMKK